MKMLTRALLLICVLILAACGGGGGASAGTPVLGSGGTGATGTTTSTATPTVIVAISKTSVTASSPATIQATVRDATGAVLSGQVVAFSSTGSLGAFTPATALTDANGVATTQLSPASSTANGADLAVAKVAIGTATVSGTIGFQIVGATSVASGSPSITVSLSSATASTATPSVVTAVVKDSLGAAITGQVVKFSTVDGLGLFSPSSALTDANGKVTVNLTPATTTTNGADLAVAQTTVNGTQLSATIGFTAMAASTSAAGAPSMTLTLSTATVTSSTPATVTAVVRNGLGVGVAGQVVKFSTVDGLGTFTVTSALTDATGSASVSLTAKSADASGADQVVATTTLGTTALQASQGFQLTSNNVSLAAFTADVGTATLSAYGQSTLTATLSGAVTGTTANVTVTSTCVAQGKATLTPSTVATSTGVAIFTYRDNGCGAIAASDSLQASVTGTTAVAALTINVASPAVGSITFVPPSTTTSTQTIFLKGSGFTETATVTFQVLDGAGHALPNKSVDLSASTLAGGLTIDGGSGPVTKVSDSLGNVSVIVNSGTVPTPVRIKATLTGGTISTVSSSLSIAVGKPSQLNFSLSQKTMNIEGANIDGTPNTYSIIASDRLGNPVPLNTAVNFVTEGGQIEPSKFTTLTNGLAQTSANYVSSEPRPADMRVTVLAYALGEESFVDTNGNNVWDAGEPFQDLGNVYLSRLFNGKYDATQDQFIALSIPGVSSSQTCAASTSSLLGLDKSIPSVPGTCDGSWGQAYVRRAVETVLSTSAARPLWIGAPSGLYTVNGTSCSSHVVGPLVTGYDSNGVATTASYIGMDGATGIFSSSTSGSLLLLAADANRVRLNPMAAGTTISVSGTTGLSGTVAGTPVPNTLEASVASISYSFDPASTATSGTLTLTFTSPSGVGTSVPVYVSQGLPPATGVCH